MPFNPESAKIAGSLSKRGPAKVLPPTTKEKLNILYEDLLEDLIINQKDLSNSEKIKLVQIILSQRQSLFVMKQPLKK